MTNDRQQPKPRTEEPTAAEAEPGMAQMGNRKVPRPETISDRSVPDDVDE